MLTYADVCCRCRIIFLSSCIVFEPTLEGDKFLDATYPHHVIDFIRILGVQSVNDGGAGEISCSSIRQHTSAYVSIRQHTSAYVSIRQHTYRQRW